MNRVRAGFVVAVITIAITPLVAAQKPAAPTVEELQRVGAEYVAAYAPKVSGVVLEELFQLIEVVAQQMQVPQRTLADIVLLNNKGDLLGLRDIFKLDNRALRERTPRIVEALSAPTPGNWVAAQRYAREHAIHLRSNVVLWYSDPTLAFQFIRASNQPRLAYKLEGSKKMNGVQVFGLGFKEREEKGLTYLLGTPDNPTASGRFWIDPATGAIHNTELWIQSEKETGRSQVSFAPDAALSVLLPKEATHTFELREKGTGMSGAGGASSKVGFECNAKYSNARYTPIDLAKTAR